MMPPSLIDYVISRNLADGVVVAGCAERSCYHRLGVEWTKQRFAGQRDPYLRARVPRDRLAAIWASPSEQHRFQAALAEFANAIAGIPTNLATVPPARNATATKAPEPTGETVP
jgi:coenzyme F420-reducing hydrogenase delta subunit